MSSKKFILYDQFTLSIQAVKKLSIDDRRDVRHLSEAILSDAMVQINNEMVPEHLKKKVRVVIE